MESRDQIFKLLERERDSIRRLGVNRLGLFGSFARDEQRPDSDVDILVKLEAGRSLLDLIAIKQDLEDLLGCKVDVVTEAAISPYIREQVLNEAVAL